MEDLGKYTRRTELYKLSSFKQKTAVNFSCLRMNALLLFPLLTISACFLIFPLMVISTLGFYIFFYFF